MAIAIYKNAKTPVTFINTYVYTWLHFFAVAFAMYQYTNSQII